ncbi:MAG TPA: type VI secretion system tip protein TssI/VgrG, partial [Candidatus Nanopelagicales bacterium]|nr:type VI secretion system tip protein TssI/VgrG [Candidatus Nanopelagicales bacterium]
MKDLITISSSVLPSSTRVVGVRGVEAISRPYQFEIFIVVKGDQDELDLADTIGAKAMLELDRENDGIPPFPFAGILASVELLHEYGGQALLRAVMVPKLWLLGLSRHSRIFTRKRITEVIQAVLEENGISGDDVKMRLGSYEVEEHITQYRESDLDFLSRWMEREGIFYWFEHGEDGEKLVLCDDRSYDADEIGKPVRYFPQTGQDGSAGASLRSFTCLHATLPAQVRLKDYDYARPNLNISGLATVDPNGVGEVSLYGERFFTPSAGQKLARIRAEELLARQVVYRGAGTRFHLRPGYTFELEDHPRSSFNARYLGMEVRHHGNQAAGLDHFRQIMQLEHEDVYFVELTAIPGGTQFRAESRAPWPRIYGYENGTVDGAADSDYAQIDDQGRYNVKFKFDESALKNGQASTFVRMMQPHGGAVEGFHFPLRKGTEVICSYLGGDPDRPVIVGVVPTAVTPSKVVSSNHTQNIIQTGGANYITIEDSAGAQYINVFCPIFNTNLYLGSPRPPGPHSLTLPSGPQVPASGPRKRDALGPFAFDLRTDGSGQVHAGGNLNVDADAELQIEAGALTTIYA